MTERPGIWRQAALVGFFVLFSTPFFACSAYSLQVPGLTSAPSCIALGLLAGAAPVGVASGARSHDWTRPARYLTVAALALALLYVVSEFCALPLLEHAAARATGTAYDLLELGLRLPHLIKTTVGYWPLTLCAMLLSRLWTDGAAEDVGPGDNVDDTRAKEEASSAPTLLTLAVAGLLRQPLGLLGQTDQASAPFGMFALPVLSLGIVLLMSRRVPERLRRLALACLGTGVLLWSCAARLAPISTTLPRDAPLAVIACALATACAMALMLWRPATLKATPAGSRVEADVTLDLSGLTPGERACAELLLGGAAISKIAERLGKAPSTTRVLLSRAYKKLGVSSAAELASLSARSVDTGAEETSPPAPARLWLPVARTSLLALLLLPLGATGRPWGAGQTLVLSFGMGLLASASLGRLVVAHVSSRERPAQRVASGVFRSVFVATGLCAIALSHLEASCMNGYPAHPLLALPTCLFAILFCVTSPSRGTPTARPTRAAEGDGDVFALPLLSLPLALVSLSQVLPPLRPALTVGCLGLAAAGAMPLADERLRTADPVRGIDVAPLAIAATVGFVMEEAWRATGSFSTLELLMPLLIALCLSSAYLMRGARWEMLCASVAGGALALGAQGAMSLRLALAAVALVAGAAAGPAATPPDAHDARRLVLPCLGAGMLAGAVAINAYCDRLLYNEVALAFLGGKTGLISAGSILLGISLTLAGLSVGAYCVRLSNDARAKDLGLGQGANDERRRRMLGFLASQGLSKTESEVLLLTARGRSGGQVSEELNYSRGTVNSARRDGYRKLSIHSRQELIERIIAGTKHVN
ncbi:LuxR C-terminal-related transcriptional regulator [Olsenella massiliensis]|uniref:LuxR C-terminal-related transcriptional regulator n=1 Tax=Olsenella massiliensis TaxID=1622075 RepID=UPI0018D25B3B|nr:LuxR C-terminal-related transcriptional regulator [Olsenella massiliensis]